MSLDGMIWAVKDAPVANCEEHAVLSVMADEADEAGCGVLLSVRTISERSKVSEREVARCIKDMFDRKLLGLGDQSKALYIRADRRPIVYDLLIPYSWFGRIERVNRNREQKQLPPLTADSRPDIADPPPKARRADYGKKRAPRDKTDGVTNSPVVPPGRGDSQSDRDGVTSSPVGLANGYPQTGKSPRDDWQSDDPEELDPVYNPGGHAAPQAPLRPQEPPSSVPGTEQPLSSQEPQDQPLEVIGNNRPRARGNTASQAGAAPTQRGGPNDVAAERPHEPLRAAS